MTPDPHGDTPRLPENEAIYARIVARDMQRYQVYESDRSQRAMLIAATISGLALILLVLLAIGV